MVSYRNLNKFKWQVKCKDEWKRSSRTNLCEINVEKKEQERKGRRIVEGEENR